MPKSSRSSFPVSTVEWIASLYMAALPVTSAAPNLQIAIATLPAIAAMMTRSEPECSATIPPPLRRRYDSDPSRPHSGVGRGSDPFPTFMPASASGPVAQKRSLASDFCWRAASRQFVEQRLCLFEILCVEAFGEPAVNRRQKIAGLSAATVVAAESSEAYNRTQFPELGPLLSGNPQGFVVQFLGGLGMPLPQQQLPFVPVQLCRQPALPSPFDDLQCLVQQGHGLFDLPGDPTCCGQEGDVIGRPRLRPSDPEGDRAAAQKRYPFGHIPIFDLDPAAVDGSHGAPVGETLLGRYRNQLLCPLVEECGVSDERQQNGAKRQGRSQRRRMSQPSSLSDCCAAPCQCLVWKAETEKQNPQKRL